MKIKILYFTWVHHVPFAVPVTDVMNIKTNIANTLQPMLQPVLMAKIPEEAFGKKV